MDLGTATLVIGGGIGLMLAMFVSIYGATRASGAIIMALNVVYEQHERRSLLRTTLISFVMILATMAVAIVGLLAASVLALLGNWATRLGDVTTVAIGIATWVIAAGLALWARSALSLSTLAPTRTTRQVRQDARALSERVSG